MATINQDPYGVIPMSSKKTDTALDRFMGGIGGQLVRNYYNDPAKSAVGSAIGSIVETFTPGKSSLYSKGVGTQPTPVVAAPIATPGATALSVAPITNGISFGQKTPARQVDPSTVYGRLTKLNDKQFKQFVDEHHGIPGVGYIQGADGTMKRLVENPANKPEEPMTIAQSDAQARMITAQGHLTSGVGSREQAAAYQAGILADKAQGRKLEEQKDFENRLDKNAIIQMDLNGNTIKNYKPWLLEQSVVNPENVHPVYKEEAHNLNIGFENYVQAAYKKYPKLSKTPENKLELLKRYQQTLLK